MQSQRVSTGDSASAAQYDNLRDDSYAASMLRPHQRTTPGMSLYVEMGAYYIGATRVLFAGGSTPTFTAPVSNPRIDLVTADSTGTIAIVQGTEGASPATPAYPAGKAVLCEVYHVVGETAIYTSNLAAYGWSAGQGYIQNDVRPELGPVYINSSAQIANGTITAANLNATLGLIQSGSVVMWPTTSAPTGWLTCDGSAVSRTTYANLFAIIGTTFGAGDGSTTFNLPNFQGNVPVGYKSGDANFGSIGATGGEVTHVLTVNEMPSHSHNFGQTGGSVYGGNSGSSAAAGNSLIVGYTGGGAAHNNLQPFLTINFIIKQ